LVGDGPERIDVEAFVRRQRLPRLVMPGYVPYRELASFYRASDLFVHAPREERWGVSVGEALACGIPVVTSTRVGAARDLIASGGNGVIYDAGHSAALAQALDDGLALDVEAARRASERALRAWDVAASWQHLLGAATRFRRSST
jgi:glycosyltransferase involved in cell wall biosynthesis